MAPSLIFVPEPPMMEMKQNTTAFSKPITILTPPDSSKDAKRDLIGILTSILNYFNSIPSDDLEKTAAQDIFLRLNPGMNSTNIEMMLTKISEQNCTWEKASRFMNAIERVDRTFGY